MLRRRVLSLFNSQQSGLLLIILAFGVVLSVLAGSHPDLAGHKVNNFLNPSTLFQTASDASYFAIMAVGATIVIISGGIDLSVGSIYALAGVTTAMLLRGHPAGSAGTFAMAMVCCVGIGLICGLLNGLMVALLKVHPFIITLGTMWMFRGIAFVASKAESILVPDSLSDVVKTSLGLPGGLHPIPTLVMLAVMLAGSAFLIKTVAGRNVYAIGGNIEASRYSGLRIERVQIGVFALSGLMAGIAAFVGVGYFGSASCNDANGYELYVIASAVVGGASLIGGKGAAFGAMLGAILIVLIRQSIRTLHFDQNYEWIIIGASVIIAVLFDQMSAKLTARRLAQATELKT